MIDFRRYDIRVDTALGSNCLAYSNAQDSIGKNSEDVERA